MEKQRWMQLSQALQTPHFKTLLFKPLFLAQIVPNPLWLT